MKIRKYQSDDKQRVIDLWKKCGLIVPWNDPEKDIERKLKDSPDLFFVGEIDDEIISICMAGFDGHRGCVNYLAVKPEFRRKGYAGQIVEYAEKKLKELGCPKINLMVRKTNQGVIDFYKRIGYKDDPVMVLSKRLIEDL
ncbi:MAG: GNAT family acetyltransferase [Candidatus Cloacimonetes bacterium]|nr:GNAT family acetyltransferase [Candidatus Cloacimonadota bacterium]